MTPLEGPLSGFRFSETLRVRYAEVDYQGIVFHAHYLTYLDVALTEYFRRLGLTMDEAGVAASGFETVLVKSTQHYRAPARYDDLLRIGVRVERLGTSSLTVVFRIVRGDGQVVLDAETVYVNYDRRRGRAAPIPDPVRTRIRRFEAGAEDDGALPPASQT